MSRTAPERESAETRGYDRREWAQIKREATKHREEWTEVFDDYLGMLVAMDDGSKSPDEMAKRAEELADARSAVIERRFE
jgi:hypothetical protein